MPEIAFGNMLNLNRFFIYGWWASLLQQPDAMVSVCGAGCDPFTMASLRHSLFRTDQRPAIGRITVPFLYVMPENPLYSMTTVEFYLTNIRGGFTLANDFPGTTHLILMEAPRMVAESVKVFMKQNS